MLIGGKDFRRNRPWLLGVVATALAAGGWYLASAIAEKSLPGGSSRPGLVFGVAGGFIIVFEFLIWPRKKVRAWRIGSAQTWLRAHVWFGLLCVPLVLMHARLLAIGGWLNISLMVIFFAVILSGIYGLALQQFLPRWLLERVPAETIYAQIGYVSRQQCDDAEKLVRAMCTFGGSADEEPGEENSTQAGYAVITGFRSMTGIQGKVLETRSVINAIPGTRLIYDEFLRVIKPYLLSGKNGNLQLSRAFAAQGFFQTLHEQSPADAHELIGRLQMLCDQRRQLDLQQRLHVWLHAWLWVHLPLSVLLLVMLAVHVFVALKYW